MAIIRYIVTIIKFNEWFCQLTSDFKRRFEIDLRNNIFKEIATCNQWDAAVL